MKGQKIKKVIFISLAVLICIFALISLYTRKPMDFTFDGAYYWPTNQYQDEKWLSETLPSGHSYYLYLPEKYKTDKDNENAKIPLIVCFHGSDEKGLSISKYGRPFIDNDFQEKIYPEGAAVLVLLSRINYFTDPHSTSLLIQNICLKNKCIDQTNIIGYGFSQGAKFVVELACTEPQLFRAVVSGSGFYQMNLKELLSVLPVQFYFATSENDKGIFEQGSPTGKKCGVLCKNSRYVQYKQRWHFWVELKDKTGKKNKDGTDETFLDWLVGVVRG